MNIVKLKDILMPETSNMAKFFNENLKGRYAYWIQMRYIFPLNSLDYKTYIQYEQFDRIKFLRDDILPHIDLYSEECSMYDFAQVYIDHDVTEIINSIATYKTSNEYITDADIDLQKIRRFRTWLAEELLKLNTNIDGGYLNIVSENVIHMLEFYKNDMYNEIVKYLTTFGPENAFQNTSMATGCSCCNGSSTLSTLSGSFTCNALDIYIKNIHNLMVQTFENVNFWKNYNKDFIILFKKYIDNIITTGLVVNKSSKNVLYATCNCNTSTYETTYMLRNLSEALGYIINEDITAHLNFINSALHEWAENLYDEMSWELK